MPLSDTGRELDFVHMISAALLSAGDRHAVRSDTWVSGSRLTMGAKRGIGEAADGHDNVFCEYCTAYYEEL